MKLICTSFLIVSAVLSLASQVSTQVSPGLMTYQGRLADSSGNPVPDGVYSVRFAIYDDPVAAAPIPWQEVHSITTTNGLFTVILGTQWEIDTGVLQNLLNYSIAYLGIKVGTDPEMTPRIRLTSVMYAQAATRSAITGSVNQATGGTITSTLKIQDSLGIGTGAYPPTERLDVAGNAVVSGKIALLSNAGPTTKPQIGERWRDNSIVAWGHIAPDGSIISAFGLDSVQHISPGHYYVYLSHDFIYPDNIAAMAQAYCSAENPYLATVLPISGDIIEVGTKFLNTNTIQDGTFSIIVTGR